MNLGITILMSYALGAGCSNKAGFKATPQVQREKNNANVEAAIPEINVVKTVRQIQVPALEESAIDLQQLFPEYKFSALKSRSATGEWLKMNDILPFAATTRPDLKLIGQSGTLLFQISGEDFVDYEIAIGITVRGPNVLASSCDYQPLPVIGEVKPELKWHWKGYDTEDKLFRYATTYSSPVVGDLDGNGDIEVVSIASQIFPAYSYQQFPALMVVLSAQDGTVEWNSIKDSNIYVESSTTPAIADLDADGFGEIIASVVTRSTTAPITITRELLIFDYKTKAPKYPLLGGFVCNRDCMPSVADLDQDGKLEIVIGNAIVSNEGKLIALLPTTAAFEPIDNRNTSSIAELDSDSPGLEIITNGSQVFSATGTLLWKGDCKGFSAIGDLDKDKKMDLVCIGGGKVVRFDSKGQKVWEKDIPVVSPVNNFRGGAPNLGNFDDDDALEIGTAGGDFYVVYNHDGSIVWQTATKDRSSHGTGSTVFDFNGDGRVEVAYNDELKLRIYDGATGNVLFEVDNYSGTLWEYPVVANIDDSESVEIILSAPGSGANDLQQGGVKVFKDPSNRWASSRKVWNQYSYYPSIVTEDLKSPKDVPNTSAGFRVNTQDALKLPPKVAAPDLVLKSSFEALLDPTGKIVDGMVVVSNKGLLASTGDWVLKVSAIKASDGSKVDLENIGGDVVESGAYRIFNLKYSLEEPMSNLTAEIAAKAGVEFRECSSKNNEIK
jgi:hypothetical protein